MNFEIQHEDQGDRVLLRLRGDLDISTAHVLRAAVDDAVGNHPRQLVFDMRELSYMSSAGLRCIAHANQTSGETTTIVLLAPRPEIADIIRLAGLDSAVHLTERLR